MKKPFVVAAVAALTAPLSYAGTIVLFDNLQGGYEGGSYAISFLQSVANPFDAPQNAILSEVVLALRPTTSLNQPTFYNISIRDAAGGVPGPTVLYSWNNVQGAGLNVLTFSTDVAVAAGGSYFVQVDAANRGLQGEWLKNSSGDSGPFAFSFGSTWYTWSDIRGGMTVKAVVPDGDDDDPGVPAVPGPLAAIPFALGLVFRRLRR